MIIAHDNLLTIFFSRIPIDISIIGYFDYFIFRQLNGRACFCRCNSFFQTIIILVFHRTICASNNIARPFRLTLDRVPAGATCERCHI